MPDTAADLEPRITSQTRWAYKALLDAPEPLWGNATTTEAVKERARMLLEFLLCRQPHVFFEWFDTVDYDALASMLMDEWG